MQRLDRESAPASARRIATPRPEPRRVGGWRARPFWAGAVGGRRQPPHSRRASHSFSCAPPADNPLLDDLVSAHVRSLMPAHLIDVESTDQHTVKPWFAGHADVSPVVADFTEQGYRLVGGRADYFDHQRAAVVVYQHGPHIINVFSWAAAAASACPPTRPATAITWPSGRPANLDYCAVSDTGWDELQGSNGCCRI